MSLTANTLVLTAEAMIGHEMAPGHPESPKRLVVLLETLADSPVPRTSQRSPRAALPTELERVHDPSHVANLLAFHHGRDHGIYSVVARAILAGEDP